MNRSGKKPKGTMNKWDPIIPLTAPNSTLDLNNSLLASIFFSNIPGFYLWSQNRVKNSSKPFKIFYPLLVNLGNYKRIRALNFWIVCSRSSCMTTTLTFSQVTRGKKPQWLRDSIVHLKINCINTFTLHNSCCLMLPPVEIISQICSISDK